MKIGFIGLGFMGKPLLNGVVNSGMTDSARDIWTYDTDSDLLAATGKELGVTAAASAGDLISACDVIVMCLKPNVTKIVLEAEKDSFTSDKVMISIAAGVSLDTYAQILGADRKIVRVMPNRPAMVGDGVTLISYGTSVQDDDKNLAKKIFSSVGSVYELDERLMNAGVALTGSSPAYVFMFIEAMADAAIEQGIPSDIALTLAAQAVRGSAHMVIETGISPQELIKAVCSPGGTTIEAVKVLEEEHLHNSIAKAMSACTKRAVELSKN